MNTIAREDNPQVAVRRFSPSDMDSVLEVETASFGEAEAYPRSLFEALYQEHPEGFLVAEVEGRVAGYIIAYAEGDTGQVDSLAVHPRYRGQEVARRLLEAALALVRDSGATRCSLEVRTANQAATGFYQHMGFRVVGRLQRYYDDGADAYVMERPV